jgi:hypothetical protein
LRDDQWFAVAFV